jgi:chromate transporter
VTSPRARIGLGAVFRIGLYYGFAGFGGGYSVISQLRRDLVDKRKLMSAEDFLVLMELSKSLPGAPTGTIMALVGQRIGGVRGGIVATTGVLLPSFFMMVACAAAYSLFRKLTELSLFFDGMNAAMVGVVGAVTIDLARAGAIKSKRDVAIAALCAVLLAARLVAEPILAVAAVIIGVARGALRGPRSGDGPRDAERRDDEVHGVGALPWLPIVLGGSAASLAALVRVFVPIGVTTFGGGLAMIPAIEHMVVIEQGWLDPKAFADAIALGQITPGPVSICATFIGYRVAGLLGAVVATLAMFVPAISLALAAGHSVDRFRASPLVDGALRTMAPVVIGMLAAATFSLGRATVGVPVDAALALASLLVLVLRPMSPLWMLVGGGLVRLAILWLTRM